MKISSIQIKNYRSISEAKIPLQDLTVILGKNNEGKSNVLMAVNVAISALQIHAELKRRMFSYRGQNNEYYKWDRDYPIDKQKGKKRDKKTRFILEFTLNDAEIVEFKKGIGHHLNGSLPIQIDYSSDNKANIKVVKPGKGSKPLNEKSQRVCKYIAEHIEFNYIPAVRTVDHSMEIINSQISARMQEERENKDYKAALQKIKEIESVIIKRLSEQIKTTLNDFLPNLKNVELISEDLGLLIRRRQDISLMIDDGNPTDLINKGDGVKSLVALSLLKNKKAIPNTASVIAIEEPESHLHPSAIEVLRKSIVALSEKSQVIVSTHNPQFVNRNEIDSNIIVDDGNAKEAANIREIREILGVKLSDNLYGAKLLLFVEGVTDREILTALFEKKSKKLRRALSDKEFVIQPISGTDHIELHLSMAKSMVSDFYVFLDNDEAGRKAVKRCQDKKLLDVKDYMLTIYDDMAKEAEIEDMLSENLYERTILEKYGVNINIGEFKAKNMKWSNRIEIAFKKSGKIMEENTLKEIKLSISTLVKGNVPNALRPNGDIFFQKLVSVLEARL